MTNAISYVMLYVMQQLHKHNIYVNDSGGIMDFRNVGNLRILFLKSRKDKHVRMRHFFLQFESPTLRTRTSSRLSGILSVSSLSGLCCLEMVHKNFVIFTSQFCFYDRKVLFNSGLYFAILPTTVHMGLWKRVRRNQANLQVFALLKVSKKVKCTFVQALRLCTGRTAHKGSRGIALLFVDHGARRE